MFTRKGHEYGKFPANILHNIFSIMSVGKPYGCNCLLTPAVGWLHPPTPTVELFRILLLLDVLKAPDISTAGHDYLYSQAPKSSDKLSIEVFFNRMLALSTEWQKKVFEYFSDIHENELVESEEAGATATAGVTNVGTGLQRAAVIAEELVCVESKSGSPVIHMTLAVESGDSRLDWNLAQRFLRECGGKVHDGTERDDIDLVSATAGLYTESYCRRAVCGYYLQKRSKRPILVVKEKLSSTYAIWRPNSRRKAEKRNLSYAQLIQRLQRFRPLVLQRAESIWSSSHRALPDMTTEQ